MWFNIQNKFINLSILVKPNAKRTAILKIDDQALTIALHATPHYGKANQALIAYLADLFQLTKKEVILKRGATGKRKHIVIPFTKTTRKIMNNLADTAKKSC
ncbi:MAG: hypothetical protein ACD_45C00464G0002 [uncultured bacterium]|nr:MAG: hypothetical protein ACD_45C00464G0002 [uncultured bacterium]